ncbi:MAG: VCBS repeat-containing protein [Planctomycetes bacterium]|nr:VCBS repeat-containing protein [Planctomycetota bacterium]
MRLPLSTLMPMLVLGIAAPLSAQNKFVNATTGNDANSGNTPGAAYATIQKGIDNVGAGFTVNVAPGTYVERLIVDPGNALGGGARGPAAFTLDGTGPGVIVRWPAVASRPALGAPLITGSGKNIDAILAAVGISSLVVTDLELDGDDDMNVNTGTFSSCNVAYVNSSGSVERCALYGVQDNPTSGMQGGIAGYVQGGSSNVDFVSCNTYDTQKTFFVCTGGTMDVLSCTITGRGKTTSIAQNGIQWSGSSGRIEGCTMTGIWWIGLPWTSTGVLPYDPSGPIVVRGNSFVDCQTGVYWIDTAIPSIDLLIEDNSFTHTSAVDQNGYDAIDVYTGDSAPGTWIVRNNEFHEVYGNSVWTNLGGGTVTGNTFDDTGSVFGLVQAQDDSAGGNAWNGNNWSDWATNAGFGTSTYQIAGAAGAVDGTPTSVIPGLGGPNAIATSTSLLPLGPSCVASSDLNGDGFNDLVVGLSDQVLGTNDKVEVLLSGGVLLGVAVFTPPGTTYTIGDEPSDIAIGDVTGDGRADLVITCKGNNSVHVLAGNGLGGFAAHHVLSFGANTFETQPTAVVIAQLAGSADRDLAISFQGSLLSGGTVRVMRNDGGGSAFTSLPIAGLAIGSGMGIDAGNFDGDADLELAVTDSGSTLTDNKIRVIDNAAGVFTQTATLTTLASPRGIDVGDVDGDGRADLAIGCFGDGGITTDGGIAVFFGDGAGGFPTSTSSVGFGGRRGTSSVAIADLNSDSGPGGSRMDVVGLNLVSANFTGLLGYTGGAFGLTRTASSGGVTPTDFTIANLDNDCAPDVIVVDLNAQSIFVHYGSGGALAQTFGTGCTGISGIPSIGTFGTPAVPTIGNPTFGVSLANARAFTLAVLLGGTGYGPGACVNLIPTPVLFTLVGYTNAVGGAQIPIPVPNDPLLDCLELYLQWAVWDPAGGFGGFSTSNALRVRVGGL